MSVNNVASRGDFRGDFSRDTFDPMKHFSRVLMQQGRVQLDADWNEQVSILLHYMRQLGRDLMGPHGAPRDEDDEWGEGKGFNIIKSQNDFVINSGRYYVNGILCENYQKDLTYFTQILKPKEPFIVENKNELQDGTYLVYLDVWERHLTYVEDDSMREKVLGGADTATRAQVVWQVKVIETEMLNGITWEPAPTAATFSYNLFLDELEKIHKIKIGTGQLKVKARKFEDNKKPCLSSPESAYRGAENQLYRVEIHDSEKAGIATFKWSRENGSVIFPITAINGNTISLRNFGHDDRFSLQKDDWVEVLDDDVILRNEAHQLLKVTAVDRENLQVTLNNTPVVTVTKNSEGRLEKHPYMRRWDQKNGDGKGVAIEWKAPTTPTPDAANKKPTESKEIKIEDGIAIQFQKDQDAVVYQRGDYWLIPARTATGDVEWPENAAGEPKALLPHGVAHHYAPLAIITVNATGNIETTPIDLRRQLNQGYK